MRGWPPSSLPDQYADQKADSFPEALRHLAECFVLDPPRRALLVESGSNCVGGINAGDDIDRALEALDACAPRGPRR